jgi:hypothetical protein
MRTIHDKLPEVETRLALANLLWICLVIGNSTRPKESKSRILCKKEAMNS